MSEKTETLVERVARRLFSVDYPDAGDVEETLWERREAFYMASARSAIEAMREPSAAMVAATEEVVVGYDDFACGDGTLYMHHDDAKSAWQAMIDAALNEKES